MINKEAIQEANRALVSLISSIAKQDKYDNEEEMSIHDIFDEAKSMIDDYEEGLNPTQSYEETLKYLRCE